MSDEMDDLYDAHDNLARVLTLLESELDAERWANILPLLDEVKSCVEVLEAL